MTDRIHTFRRAMQAADGETMVDSVLSQSQGHQLRPRNNPVLPLSQTSNLGVEAAVRARLHAKPSQPGYIAG